MLSVCYGVADDLRAQVSKRDSNKHEGATHVLEEDLENTTRLLVDEAGDTLHTTTTCETADSWLGDTLNVVAENLAVTLGAALAETLQCKSARVRIESKSS